MAQLAEVQLHENDHGAEAQIDTALVQQMVQIGAKLEVLPKPIPFETLSQHQAPQASRDEKIYWPQRAPAFAAASAKI